MGDRKSRTARKPRRKNAAGKNESAPKPLKKVSRFSPSKTALTQKSLKQTEKLIKKLRDSQEKYRLVVEASPNMVFIIQEGKIIYVNPAMARMTGMAAEDLVVNVQDVIQRHIAPEYMELVRNNLKKRLAGEPVDEYEVVTIDKDGIQRNMIVKSQLVEYRGKPAEIGLFVDITEHRIMEQRLRIFYQAVDQAMDGIAVFDENERVLFANSAWANMHGMEVNEVIGESVSIFHSRDQFENEVEPLLRELERRGSLQSEIGHRRTDGSIFRTWMSTTLLKDEGEKKIGIVVVARDIAERKRMEDKVIRSEKLAMAGLIASGIAHEINNPLTAIYASAQILANELSNASAHVKERVGNIMSGSERIRELIKQFMDFARPESHLNKINVDVNEILRRSITMTAHMKKEETRVKASLQPELPLVFADPNQLLTVFTNLLVNAHQAMEIRGDLIEVESRVIEGNMIEVVVRDNGPGVPPEAADRIFEPFYSTKSSEKGTGLGLAIVHTIVSDMGGNIKFSSEIGSMTEFFVELPAATKKARSKNSA